MPVTINPQILDDLVKRQIEAEQMQKRFAPDAADAPAPEGSLNPSLLTALGAAADGISTYRFLKKGTGTEDNALFNGAVSNNPAMTGAIAAGTGLIGPLLAKVLKNKLPESVIDAVIANLGARTTASAAANFEGNADGFVGQNELLNISRIHNKREQQLPSRLPARKP
jgi:hypothetical protein